MYTTLKLVLIIAAFLLPAALSTSALAEEDPAIRRGRPLSDTRNPASIEGQIDDVYGPRQPHVGRRPRPLLQPWYDFKDRLESRHGLRFGVAYTPLHQGATDSLTAEDQASGAIFEAFGTWDLVCRRGGRTGTLGFRVEDRHGLWSGVVPQSLSAEIGAGVPTGIGFSDFDLSLAELWWEQQIVEDRFSVRLGKMLPFGYHDFFLFKNPKTDFTNAAFALNPTIAWPQFGLGAVVEVRPRKDIYLVAGIHDANGDPTRFGADTFFEDNEYFTIGEIGWDPGFLSKGKKNPTAPDFHVTAWHADARTKAGRPEGWGVSVTGQKAFGQFTPFVRYGYSDGGAALLQQLVMAGVGWRGAFCYEQDTIGLAAGWGKPSSRGADDQFTSELYYRMQFVRQLALTFTAQVISNPSMNPTTSVIGVFGIRARLDF